MSEQLREELAEAWADVHRHKALAHDAQVRQDVFEWKIQFDAIRAARYEVFRIQDAIEHDEGTNEEWTVVAAPSNGVEVTIIEL